MKPLVYHGPGQRAWEDVPDSAHRRRDGRRGPDRLLDDLWDGLTTFAEPKAPSRRGANSRHSRALEP